MISNEKRWRVTVEFEGEQVISIENDFYGGKSELTDEECEAVRIAAENLLAFVGRERSTLEAPSDDLAAICAAGCDINELTVNDESTNLLKVYRRRQLCDELDAINTKQRECLLPRESAPEHERYALTVRFLDLMDQFTATQNKLQELDAT